MDKFITGTLATIGCDLGRYLYQVKGNEVSDKELVDNAIIFVLTFNVKLNMENVQERQEFLVAVARGYERMRSE